MANGFITAMGTGVLIVLGLLILLFGSVFQPVTILLSLPLSFGGVALSLLVTDNSISMPVYIGLLMLMGIVTKNAIMLVDFAIEEIANGVERREAIIDAGRKRARPIIMTTLAMAAGMLPSAFALGDGGEFRAPMAIAVIGGLLVSTMLSLVFVPSFFTVMDDFGWLMQRIFGRFVGPKRRTGQRPITSCRVRATAQAARCRSRRNKIERNFSYRLCVTVPGHYFPTAIVTEGPPPCSTLNPFWKTLFAVPRPPNLPPVEAAAAGSGDIINEIGKSLSQPQGQAPGGAATTGQGAPGKSIGDILGNLARQFGQHSSTDGATPSQGSRSPGLARRQRNANPNLGDILAQLKDKLNQAGGTVTDGGSITDVLGKIFTQATQGVERRCVAHRRSDRRNGCIGSRCGRSADRADPGAAQEPRAEQSVHGGCGGRRPWRLSARHARRTFARGKRGRTRCARDDRRPRLQSRAELSGRQAA